MSGSKKRRGEAKQAPAEDEDWFGGLVGAVAGMAMGSGNNDADDDDLTVSSSVSDGTSASQVLALEQELVKEQQKARRLEEVRMEERRGRKSAESLARKSKAEEDAANARVAHLEAKLEKMRKARAAATRRELMKASPKAKSRASTMA